MYRSPDETTSRQGSDRECAADARGVQADLPRLDLPAASEFALVAHGVPVVLVLDGDRGPAPNRFRPRLRIGAEEHRLANQTAGGSAVVGRRQRRGGRGRIAAGHRDRAERLQRPLRSGRLRLRKTAGTPDRYSRWATANSKNRRPTGILWVPALMSTSGWCSRRPGPNTDSSSRRRAAHRGWGQVSSGRRTRRRGKRRRRRTGRRPGLGHRAGGHRRGERRAGARRGGPRSNSSIHPRTRRTRQHSAHAARGTRAARIVAGTRTATAAATHAARPTTAAATHAARTARCATAAAARATDRKGRRDGQTAGRTTAPRDDPVRGVGHQHRPHGKSRKRPVGHGGAARARVANAHRLARRYRRVAVEGAVVGLRYVVASLAGPQGQPAAVHPPAQAVRA